MTLLYEFVGGCALVGLLMATGGRDTEPPIEAPTTAS